MPEGELTASDWRRVHALLDDLLDLSESDQERRLRELESEGPAIVQELRSLLASDRESGGLLDGAASEVLETLIREVVDDGEKPPDQAGAYRVVSEIGRGGMGVVYLAERSDGAFEQRVALKVVKRGLDTDAILARFRRERQILARLEHDAIARIFDGGALADGRPYFAMEFVDGEPLTEACDRARMSVERRLRLFQRVCDAVQYAHGRLVVHRDLKPSNILLDDRGQLKLLDFGIAGLLDEEVGDLTRMTAAGTRPLTPAYAAPEQFEGGTTVASDVYSLGVVLCELIAGLRPRGAGDRSVTLPSALARSARGSAGERAARRGTDPTGLARRLSGDLDAIVSKALHEEPARRYASAESLSRDIERHLSGLPVEAAPDSPLYRARKFVTRHRLGVTSTAAVLLALVAGLAGTTWQAKQRALEARKAEEVRDFALGLFESVDPSLAQGAEVTALDLVAQGAERIETDLAGQPEVQSEMEQLLGNVLWNLGQGEQGLALLDRALSRLPATGSVERANALRSKGGILLDLGRTEEAEPLLRQALEMHRESLGPSDPEVAEDLDRLVLLTLATGDRESARELAEQSLAVRLASLGGGHVDTADSYNNLGVLYRQAGDYGAAEENYRLALAIRQSELGDRHPDTLDSLANFATLLYFRGKYEAARANFAQVVAIHDEVYGPSHPATVRARNNLAAQLTQLARFDEAEVLYREVLDFWAETTGLEHPNALGTRSNLGLIARLRGQIAEAVTIDREVLVAATAVLGASHPLSARFANRLASSLREAGELGEALDRARSSLEAHEQALGAEAPQVATDLQLVGLIQRDLGELEAARSSLERALTIRTDNHGPSSVFVAESQVVLGEVLGLLGHTEPALELLRSGLETSRTELPEGHPATARAAWVLGRTLDDAGRPAEAESILAEAVAISAAVFGVDSWRTIAVQVDHEICRARSGGASPASLNGALDSLRSELGTSHPLLRRAAGRIASISTG